MCKVLTEEQEAESVLLSADEAAPFTISPSNGVLEPSSEASFTVICNPKKVMCILNLLGFTNVTM